MAAGLVAGQVAGDRAVRWPAAGQHCVPQVQVPLHQVRARLVSTLVTACRNQGHVRAEASAENSGLCLFDIRVLWLSQLGRLAHQTEGLAPRNHTVLRTLCFTQALQLQVDTDVVFPLHDPAGKYDRG